MNLLEGPTDITTHWLRTTGFMFTSIRKSKARVKGKHFYLKRKVKKRKYL